MQITFLGVGEACDHNYLNTSLIADVHGQSILIDCGFSVPHNYFKNCQDPDELDILLISHFHGDHFFGVPLLLLRLWEMGRKKVLTICGGAGTQEKIQAAMDLAYPNFFNKLNYDVNFIEFDCNHSHQFEGITLTPTAVNHSQQALGYRIDSGSAALYYSGDGSPLPKSLEIAGGCDLIVHEAYRMSKSVPGHCTVVEAIDFATQAEAEALALVHISRQERTLVGKNIAELQLEARELIIFLPEQGTVYTL